VTMANGGGRHWPSVVVRGGWPSSVALVGACRSANRGMTRTDADGRGRTRTDADGRGLGTCAPLAVIPRERAQRGDRGTYGADDGAGIAHRTWPGAVSGSAGPSVAALPRDDREGNPAEESRSRATVRGGVRLGCASAGWCRSLGGRGAGKTWFFPLAGLVERAILTVPRQ
jgi:hypothetical protein